MKKKARSLLIVDIDDANLKYFFYFRVSKINTQAKHIVASIDLI